MTAALGPQTVAVSAHKGGVGKTTTAMALAAALARAGQSVLLIDLDPQGHSTLGLGVEVQDGAPTVRDMFMEEPVPVASCYHATAVDGLCLVPATIRLERVAQWLYARPRRELRLRQALEGASGFSWCIVDCPPSLGPLVENALFAADRVIIPCRMEARATDGLLDLLEVLQLLRPGFNDWRILRTQRDSRRSVTNAAIETALGSWRTRLLETVIPQSEALNQAQIAREDIFSFDPHCAGAEAYRALVAEVIAVWPPANALV